MSLLPLFPSLHRIFHPKRALAGRLLIFLHVTSPRRGWDTNEAILDFRGTFLFLGIRTWRDKMMARNDKKADLWVEGRIGDGLFANTWRENTLESMCASSVGVAFISTCNRFLAGMNRPNGKILMWRQHKLPAMDDSTKGKKGWALLFTADSKYLCSMCIYRPSQNQDVRTVGNVGRECFTTRLQGRVLRVRCETALTANKKVDI